MGKLNIKMLDALKGQRRLKIVKLLAETERDMTAGEITNIFNLKGKYIYTPLSITL